MRLSIIALCYQHAPFLDQALASLENLQIEGGHEIRVVDDASRDGSADILKRWQQKHPDWHFDLFAENKGNCFRFNEAVQKCTGTWLLDFATDDLLLPDVLGAWLDRADTLTNPGFCYADARVFTSDPDKNKRFSELFPDLSFPEGQILPALLDARFICPPAVLFHRENFRRAGGYDARLAYEDWDAWLRLARTHEVVRFAQPVVLYRRHAQSLSASVWNKRNSRILESTALILDRISAWPELAGETDRLAWFARYHLRQCLLVQCPEPAKRFLEILKNLKRNTTRDLWMCRLSRNLPFLFPLYRRWKNRREEQMFGT
jgi:glycosyltransferase involved in cell wall biosynthesis